MSQNKGCKKNAERGQPRVASDLQGQLGAGEQAVSRKIKSLAIVSTRTVVGVEALPVRVEVHLANGLPSFSTVGLAETTVKESKDRVRGAILNSGFEFPAKRITVNLSPADLPKNGGRFDLPIAIGILIASEQIAVDDMCGFELIGELALDGALRAVSGVLPTAMACFESQRSLILPSENALEASLTAYSTNFQASNLLDVCHHLVGDQALSVCVESAGSVAEKASYPDLSDVKGQLFAKRAVEIAASGGHGLLMIGPPGTGKSMLASRLPGILPELDLVSALEVAAIESVSQGSFDVAHWRRRPYRSPHHSSSAVAMVGGGSYPKPGEITMAHQGVLFLDELTEFSRSALEQLREPLESGVINIARANQSVQYPAQFMLVAACNPCRCGYYNDGTDRCACSASSIQHYCDKLSGPMLDRIDMHVALSRVSLSVLNQKQQSLEKSVSVKERVIKVRAIQLNRQGKLNSRLSMGEIERYCDLSVELSRFLESACDKLNMSARAFHRVLMLSRTLADMASAQDIGEPHLLEALNLRSLDRR